jgi:hypothetical protein
MSKKQPVSGVRCLTLVTLIIIGFTVAGSGIATAATATPVSTTPESETVDVGQTVTFDVQLDTVNNGVSSYEFDAALDNPDVAKITDVSLQGTSASDTLTTVDYSNNNSNISVAAGSADHSDGVIASITVETTEVGTTNLSLSGVTVGDADANSYAITSANGATVTAVSQATAVTIRPENKTVPEGGTATVDVVVPDADAGVGSYEFNVSIADSSISTIEKVSLVGADQTDDLTQVEISDEGAAASITTADGDIDGERIATLRLRGHAVDSTSLTIESATVGDDTATSYQISLIGSADIRVKSPPQSVVSDSNPPTDTDGDGTFEDVNGDGDFTIVDVNAILQNRNANQVTDYPEYFDYNNDGEFTIVDVNALLQKVANS